MKKVLLLGSTGKMGSAVKSVFQNDYEMVCKNSADFDARDFEGVRNMINVHAPDIVINAVAVLSVDSCEKDPENALTINTLYPRLLAALSKERGFLLVHFSSDAVFNDTKGDYYLESDPACPVNVYGFTKYGADCFIRAIAENYYIFRISTLFGETARETQFVEKMLKRVREGDRTFMIVGDIISSPSYTMDIAKEMKRIMETPLSHGVYHIANEGRASLYDLMDEIKRNLGLDIKVEKVSYREFTSSRIKNTLTPIRSEKITQLRPWQDAVKEYCMGLREIKV